jgi:chromosome transmission fidelity protein 1
MSEGINFSDALARCVCVVGLPYSNIGSADMVEKMRYLDTLKLSTNNTGESAGRAYYENTCWKAINQSIGRAIRHRADYACLLLIDKRYTRTAIPSKLPHWLANSFYQMKTFSTACQSIEQVRVYSIDRLIRFSFCFVFSSSRLVLCSTENLLNIVQ